MRLTIFDKKEEIKNFALHSFQGLILVLKTINKLDVAFFQETIELNYHFLVNIFLFLILFSIKISFGLRKIRKQEVLLEEWIGLFTNFCLLHLMKIHSQVQYIFLLFN